MSIDRSFEVFEELIPRARDLGVGVRGYVSTAFWCPFENRVSPDRVLRVIERLMRLGVTEVSVGDTIGKATPREVSEVIEPAVKTWGSDKIAVHFHDTRGTALANTLRALELGVRTVDSSAGGLGGCPFAPGATGNLATEDLVYFLNGEGFKTGVDLDRLCTVSRDFQRSIGKTVVSRVLQAWISQCQS